MSSIHPEVRGGQGGHSWSELQPAPPSLEWDGGPEWEPRTQAGEDSRRILVAIWGSGQEVGPEEGATPHWPPLPLPGGTTRHAAAYHPCQPSPPGNVAAFSATPSGVPAAAPRHTAAGGGGGSGAGAHPGARRKRQVPLPQRPLDLGGAGGWDGGGRCSNPSGAASSSRTASAGAVWAVPGCPSRLLPTAANARSSGPWRGYFPALPPPSEEVGTGVPSHLPAPLSQAGPRTWMSGHHRQRVDTWV
jgi:hypothetical protein